MKKIRVQLFTDTVIGEFENSMDLFLEEIEEENLIGIKFSTTYSTNYEVFYSALIIYKLEKE